MPLVWCIGSFSEALAVFLPLCLQSFALRLFSFGARSYMRLCELCHSFFLMSCRLLLCKSLYLMAKAGTLHNAYGFIGMQRGEIKLW